MGKGNKNAGFSTRVARRRRGEDAAEWVPPEFDEVEFMRQEVNSAKASVVSVVYAVPVAVASYLLTLARVPIAAFFAGLGLIFLLYYLMPLLRPITGVDTSKFKRRDWMGHGAIVFFSWLAFWILLLNPPFGDFTRPDITNVAFATAASPASPAIWCRDLFPGDNPGMVLGTNASVYVAFRAMDNVAVARANATFDGAAVPLSPVGGSLNRCRGGAYPAGTYAAFFPAPAPGLHRLVTVAVDASGNAFGLTFQFTLT